MSPKAVAIIPARGGSKRIPRKNIRLFSGKPIIAYSIEAALASGCFDEVMVSTDDAEIAEVAKQYGAQTPFFRSEKNADDMAMLADVVKEVLLDYEKSGQRFEIFCCILPTAPFVTSARLKQGYQLLSSSSNADAVVPVVRFGYPIQRALKISQNELSMFWPENYSARSQDLEPAYHDSGQFYWMRSDRFMAQGRLFAKHTLPLELPESEVQDIDTEEDWKIAEFKCHLLNPNFPKELIHADRK